MDGWPPIQMMTKLVNDLLAEPARLGSSFRATPGVLKRKADRLFGMGRALATKLGGSHAVTQKVFFAAQEFQSLSEESKRQMRYGRSGSPPRRRR
jgi:hypothetical protein